VHGSAVAVGAATIARLMVSAAADASDIGDIGTIRRRGDMSHLSERRTSLRRQRWADVTLVIRETLVIIGAWSGMHP
jgi:hypothetical protein